MIDPEFDPDIDLNIEIPDDVSSIYPVELAKNADTFRDLRDEIARVELLGTDNRARQSVHKTYSEDGVMTVWFYADNLLNVGRANRVVINFETSDDEEEGSVLYIEDYIIAYAEDNITLQSTWLWRSPDAEGWSIQEETGPVLFKRYDRMDVLHGVDYRLDLPDLDIPLELSDKMEQTQIAEMLIGHLAVLSKATHDEQVTRVIE